MGMYLAVDVASTFPICQREVAKMSGVCVGGFMAFARLRFAAAPVTLLVGANPGAFDALHDHIRPALSFDTTRSFTSKHHAVTQDCQPLLFAQNARERDGLAQSIGLGRVALK